MRAAFVFLLGLIHPGHCRPQAPSSPNVDKVVDDNRNAMQRSISTSRILTHVNRRTMAPINQMLAEMKERDHRDG